MRRILVRLRDKLVSQGDLRPASLRAALKEQKLDDLYARLCKIVPDIDGQYTDTKISNAYIRLKVRAVHAFQVSLVKQAVKLFGQPECLVDIGDSSGTHIQYLKSELGNDLQTLSVNLDQDAVARIRAKGLDAECCRAEDLSGKGIKADCFLLFETLEHLSDPVAFLYQLAKTGDCKCLVLTVPYLASSRVGLHHVRGNRKSRVTPENTHIFELSPEDWKLLFRHAGWRVMFERIYLQYPRRHPLAWMKGHWRDEDFEGFYGVILQPDAEWADRYTGWSL